MTEGSFGGIGVEVGMRDGYPTVISPIEGTPGVGGGLRSGDVIVAHRRQVHLRASAVEEVSDRLRGAAGTQVRVRVAAKASTTSREIE